MPGKRPGKRHGNVKNPEQYEGLRDEGISRQRAERIANSPGASKRGGKKAAAKRKKRS
jgi:hypothetical protein